MIRINKIESFDKTVTTLADIKSEYFQHINTAGNGDSIKKTIEDAISYSKIIDINGDTYKLSSDESLLLEHINQNLQNIIDGNASELKNHINIINSNTNHKKVIYQPSGELSKFSKNVLAKIFDYKKFRSSKKKSGWYCRKLNIKACPFCNNQYTLVANRKGIKQDLSFTLDHYFPKSKYPYLAISMYNLIPCCGSCNQKKSDKNVNLDLDFHPYHSNLNLATYFKVGLPDKIYKMDASALNKESERSFPIIFKHRYKETKQIAKHHDKTYNLSGLYERHSDIAKRLVYLSKQYSKNGIAIHKALGLITSKKSALEYLLGNYLNEEDINKRPLSKLTQDIAKQFNLLD